MKWCTMQVVRMLMKGFKYLFCFLLFVAPFAEYIVPGGEVYLACIVGIAAFIGVLLDAKCRQRTFLITGIDILFFLCLVYVVTRMSGPINMELCVKLIAVGGIWSYTRLNATFKFQNMAVFGVVVSVLGQSVIGCFQSMGFLESFHSEFAVTGTFGNPGPFGGYLAVGLTVLIPYMLQHKHSPIMWGCLFVCLIIIFVAFVLSDSRAAWCAAGMSILLFSYFKYVPRKRIIRFGIVMLFVMSIPFVIACLYDYRPASVAARMQIWRVCGEIMSQSPLTGIGTGRFAACYMPAQAEYLVDATEHARSCAADNTFSYNEMLTILCEQGVVGLLLVVTFLRLVLRELKYSFQSSGAVFLYPVMTMLFFSQFSYPLSIWSLLSLFLFMSAIDLRGKCFMRLKIPVSVSLICCFLLIGGLGLYWHAQSWINDYGVFATSSKRPERFVEQTIRHAPFLLECYTEIAYLRADYDVALENISELNNYVSTARLSVKQGECYEATGDTLKALDCYRTASRMVPGLMYPVFAEFNLFRKNNQEFEALLLARRIVAFNPKVENSRTVRMKKEALRYIHDSSI